MLGVTAGGARAPVPPRLNPPLPVSVIFLNSIIFMPPAWKVRRGHLVIGSSVRPSVCPSVCPSVRNSVPLTIKVQYLKFGWWYNYQTWTVSSSKGCSHFTDITRPWGVGQGQNVGLRDFCHNWTLLPPGASVFHKHMFLSRSWFMDKIITVLGYKYFITEMSDAPDWW